MKKIFSLIIFFLINITIASSQNSFTPNGIIGLITDYGTKDFYVGALKGSILNINSGAKIIDITHEIKAFDIREGMFTTLLAAREFPTGTIILTIVDPGVGTERRPILLETKDGMVFIGPDNGVFSLIMDKFGVKQVREITNKDFFRKSGVSKSFHGRDIFGPTAANISLGKELEKCGDVITNYVVLPIQSPIIKDNKITGEVIFIDNYGNLQFNFGTYFLETLGIKLSDIVKIKINNKIIECPFMRTYGDVPKNSFLIFESSTDFLELAINEGDAKKYFNAKLGDLIEIYRMK